MQKLATCLWFDGQAEEAMNFYASIFKNSKKGAVMPGPGGAALSATFEIDGHEFIGLNGGPHYKFTPAISLFVKCTTQQEVDTYWDKLLADGGVPNQCGWLQDKFGVSWQIVPNALGEMLQDKDREKAGRVMQAMMKMVKLDIATLQRAYDQR